MLILGSQLWCHKSVVTMRVAHYYQELQALESNFPFSTDPNLILTMQFLAEIIFFIINYRPFSGI